MQKYLVHMASSDKGPSFQSYSKSTVDQLASSRVFYFRMVYQLACRNCGF